MKRKLVGLLIFWNNSAKYDRIEKIEYKRNTTEFKKFKNFNYKYLLN